MSLSTQAQSERSPQPNGETVGPHKQVPATTPDESDEYFKDIYRNFYATYRVGPADELAIRILGQPDYSLEKVTISPVGRIYHPLIGEVEVVGLTISRLTDRLTTDLSQYIKDPKVSVSLLTANSAKVGVLGDVNSPGVILMARPMTVLDAITAVGGVTDHGSKTNITLHRQMAGGRLYTSKVNIKRILEGKAAEEENMMLRAGDIVVVHGNTRKKFSLVSSLIGFGRFAAFVAGR
jgi:polysaccharide export outer membrane protein